MSLKCSVFGHQYGTTEVEREREQDGEEVVLTEREVRACQRCGKRLVVSENKEVTTVETGGSTGTGTEGPTVVGQEAGAESSGIIVEGSTGSSVGETIGTPGGDGPTDSSGARFGADRIPDAERDDVDDDLPPPQEEDAAFINDEGEEVDPEEWTTADEQPEELDDWEPSMDPDPDPEPVPETTGGEGEFHCSECGYTAPVEQSPVRAGDYCPECHLGVVEHRSKSP